MRSCFGLTCVFFLLALATWPIVVARRAMQCASVSDDRRFVLYAEGPSVWQPYDFHWHVVDREKKSDRRLPGFRFLHFRPGTHEILGFIGNVSPGIREILLEDSDTQVAWINAETLEVDRVQAWNLPFPDTFVGNYAVCVSYDNKKNAQVFRLVRMTDLSIVEHSYHRRIVSAQSIGPDTISVDYASPSSNTAPKQIQRGILRITDAVQGMEHWDADANVYPLGDYWVTNASQSFIQVEGLPDRLVFRNRNDGAVIRTFELEWIGSDRKLSGTVKIDDRFVLIQTERLDPLQPNARSSNPDDYMAFLVDTETGFKQRLDHPRMVFVGAGYLMQMLPPSYSSLLSGRGISWTHPSTHEQGRFAIPDSFEPNLQVIIPGKNDEPWIVVDNYGDIFELNHPTSKMTEVDQVEALRSFNRQAWVVPLLSVVGVGWIAWYWLVFQSVKGMPLPAVWFVGLTCTAAYSFVLCRLGWVGSLDGWHRTQWDPFMLQGFSIAILLNSLTIAWLCKEVSLGARWFVWIAGGCLVLIGSIAMEPRLSIVLPNFLLFITLAMVTLLTGFAAIFVRRVSHDRTDSRNSLGAKIGKYQIGVRDLLWSMCSIAVLVLTVRYVSAYLEHGISIWWWWQTKGWDLGDAVIMAVLAVAWTWSLLKHRFSIALISVLATISIAKMVFQYSQETRYFNAATQMTSMLGMLVPCALVLRRAGIQISACCSKRNVNFKPL